MAAGGRGGCLALVLAGAVLVRPAPARAHAPRSMSYSVWSIAGGSARVRVEVPLLEVARAGPALGIVSAADLAPGSAADRSLAAYLAAHIAARRGGKRCPLISAPTRVRSTRATIAYRWETRCPGGRPPEEIAFSAFFEFARAPTHVHIARVRMRGPHEKSRSYAALLSNTRRSLSLRPGERPARSRRLADFFLLGIRHIASGYDHLAFLVALLLAADSPGTVARAVTGFTLGHSLTLGLALGRVIAVDRAASVEALIGLSVAVVAAEPLLGEGALGLAALLGLALAASAGGWLSVPAPALLGVALFSAAHMRARQRGLFPRTLPLLAAAAFGLIHGLGFAGAISDLEIEPGAFAAVLAGFNLGVEAGQLAALALVVALVAVARRLGAGPAKAGWLRQVAAALLVALGTAWFVARGT